MDVINMAAIASFFLKKRPHIIHKQLIAKKIYEKV